MEKSIHFGVLSIIIVSFALLAAGLALAEGEPVLTLDSPEDGDWFTNPNVTVVGTLGNVSRTLVLNMTNLGTTVSEGIDQMSGSLVYRVSPYFADEFNGNQLNTSKWTEVYSSQWLDVSSGWLILGSGGIDDYPLIASAAGMFPQDMDVPWEAEFRFKYDTGGRFFNVVGGGLTKSTYAADSSHMAVHHEHFEPGFYLYANGDSVRTMSSEDTGWNSYLLKYNPETEKYRVYMDGSFVSEFTRADAPTRFWFGSPLTGTSTIFSQSYIDYVRLWTYSGHWESEVVDLGGSAVLNDASFAWSTTKQGTGKVVLQMSVSSDNTTWSPWTKVASGADPVEARFIKFRADFSLPYVRDTSERVTLSKITLDYHYKIESLEYDHDGAGWQPIDIGPEWTFDLDLNEDMNRIEVRTTDSVGANNTTAIELLLDTTAPTGSLVINGGDEYTASLLVDLDLTAEDRYGVAKVHLYYDPEHPAIKVMAFCETLQFQMEGIDGLIELNVRFEDVHGLLSEPVMDSITLDATAPTGSIIIDDGAQYSTRNNVTLALEYGDANGALTLELSNDEDFGNPTQLSGDEETYEWGLGMATDGIAWVYLRLTDIVGNMALFNDSIEVYFPKAEGNISIEGGAGLTSKQIVMVTVEAPAHLSARLMQFSEDPSFDGASWDDYGNEKIWLFSESDGEKTLYARFEDFRYIVSLPISATISLDATAPVVGMTIDDGAQYTTYGDVELGLTFADDHPGTDLWVSNDDDIEAAELFEVDDMISWTLPAVEGEHTVFVWMADGAGNIGQASDTIILTTVLPIVTISIAEVTNADGPIPVNIMVIDQYGGIQVQVALDAVPSTESPWLSFDPVVGSVDINLKDTEEGAHTVHVRVKNAAGLLSEVATADLVVDRTPPIVVITFPKDGASLTQKGLGVDLVLDVSDGSGTFTIEYRVDDGNWTPIPDGPLEMPDHGEHTIDIRVTDEAGNVATASTEFRLTEESDSPGPSSVMALAAMGLPALAMFLGRRRRGQ